MGIHRVAVRRTVIVLGAVGATALAVTGMAVVVSATTPTTSGVFSACLNTKTGVLGSVTIAPATPIACPKGATTVSWNAQGPVGATGAIGATGAPGPAGPAGPSGSDGTTILNGVGAPASDLGRVGDLYLDTTAYAFYGPKTADGWGSAHPLMPASSPTPTGDQSPTPTSSPTGSVTCGAEAVPPNASVTCISGQYVITGCSYPYADADGAFANGCEDDLMTDPNNCGRVGNQVSVVNGVAGCRNGAAYIVTCNEGYYDLDGLVTDGCEYSGPLPTSAVTPWPASPVPLLRS